MDIGVIVMAFYVSTIWRMPPLSEILFAVTWAEVAKTVLRFMFPRRVVRIARRVHFISFAASVKNVFIQAMRS